MSYAKFIVSILFSIISCHLFAQNSEQMAAMAFDAAEYADAAQLYDMAASLASGDAKAAFYDAAKKSRKCRSLSAKAADLYAQGNIADALEAYAELARLNPKDKTAVSRKRSLDAIIAKNKAAAKAEKDRRAAYKKALAVFDDASIDAFVRKYKDSEDAAFVNSLRDNFNNARINGPLCDSIAFYNKAAEVFAENDNVAMSEAFFEMSASFGDSYALYRRALMFEKGSDQYNTLIAVSAAGGCSEAASLAAPLTYDRAIAKKYADALVAYAENKDMFSGIYVAENSRGFFVDYLPTVSSLVSKVFVSGMEWAKLDDRVLYYLAVNAERFGCITMRQDFLWAAARKGNVDAMRAYLPYVKGTEAESLKFCIEYAARARTNADWMYKYVSFLRTGKLTPDDAWSLYLSGWMMDDVISVDKHEYLAFACLMADGSYTYKRSVKYLKTVTDDVYDQTYLSWIRGQLSERSDEYAPKILKRLSKMKTGCIYSSGLKRMLDTGILDSPHRTSDPGVIEAPFKEVEQRMKDKALIDAIDALGGEVKWNCTQTVNKSKDIVKVTLKHISDNQFNISLSGPLSITLPVYLQNGTLKAVNQELRKARLNDFSVTLVRGGGNLAISGSCMSSAYVYYYFE